jgi:hypothetical protein
VEGDLLVLDFSLAMEKVKNCPEKGIDILLKGHSQEKF